MDLDWIWIGFGLDIKELQKSNPFSEIVSYVFPPYNNVLTIIIHITGRQRVEMIRGGLTLA